MIGMIQVYTGNGKGKTTAAIGLSVRALGAGLRVMFLQFMKVKGSSEHRILEEFTPRLVLKTVGMPFFISPEGVLPAEEKKSLRHNVVVFPYGNPPADYLAQINEGLDEAAEALSGGRYDLVVLDEINVALHFGLVSWERLAAILDSRAESTEVVLTGRGAPQELIDKADLVTEMKEVRHYYRTRGLGARKGIEY